MKGRTAMLRMFLCITIMTLMACPQRDTPDPGLLDEKDSSPRADPNRDRVVATVGDKKITVGMLSDELNRQNPYIRMRFTSDERKKEFLTNMVRVEVLAKEARRLGLQRDPEVIRRVKRVMIERMMEKLRNTLVKIEEIRDSDIEAYYKKNIEQYRQPAKVRASQIVLKTREEAFKVLAMARKKPTDVKYFSELVEKHSIDETSVKTRGDLQFFAEDSTRVPKEVVKATFAIKALWQLGGPVKTDKGWVVLMKTGATEAVNRPLEMEKDRIKNRLFNERRIAAVEQFVKKLQDKAKIHIEHKNLAKVKIDPRPAPPPRGGP